jgi:hypothetical protein
VASAPTIAEVIETGRAVLHLAKSYPKHLSTERSLDPALFGYLHGRFGRVVRQRHVRIHGSTHPKRIDFRTGGAYPVVWEFAVRPRDGSNQLSGKCNLSELRKLTRVLPSQARLRVLLLVDLAPDHIPLRKLRVSYDLQHAGRGRFHRHSVRIIYVHEDETYHFLWRPYSVAAT